MCGHHLMELKSITSYDTCHVEYLIMNFIDINFHTFVEKSIKIWECGYNLQIYRIQVHQFIYIGNNRAKIQSLDIDI